MTALPELLTEGHHAMIESKPSVKLMSRPEFQHLRPVVDAVQREVNERGGDCRVEEFVAFTALHLYDAAPIKTTEALRQFVCATYRDRTEQELQEARNAFLATSEGRALLQEEDDSAV